MWRPKGQPAAACAVPKGAPRRRRAFAPFGHKSCFKASREFHAPVAAPPRRNAIPAAWLGGQSVGHQHYTTTGGAMTTAVDARRFVRAFAAPIRCQKCSDWMIAPVSSEFVVGGEIRHHWEC